MTVVKIINKVPSSSDTVCKQGNGILSTIMTGGGGGDASGKTSGSSNSNNNNIVKYQGQEQTLSDLESRFWEQSLHDFFD